MTKEVLALVVSEDQVTPTHLTIEESSNKGNIDIEATDLLESLKDSLLQLHQRKTVEGVNGRWYCVQKPKGTFMALSSSSYPDRLGYALLNVLL